MEQYSVFAAGVPSGSNLALVNLFNPAASPTVRGRIYDILVGSPATPADQAATFAVNRTTGVGTEGSGFVPVNLDPAGPDGAYDAGIGAFSVEPTKTANKELLVFPLNQRATFRFVAGPGRELVMAAAQNNGACLQTKGSTSTQQHTATVLFAE